MCDYCSNYRACRPQLVHSFSFISFLINRALVITGFVRGGFNALTVQHSKLLNTSLSFHAVQPFFLYHLQTISASPCAKLSSARYTICLLHLLSHSLTWSRSIVFHNGEKEKRYRNKLREKERKEVMVTGAGLRRWPARAAVQCVNYSCKTHYIKREHLLAG